MSIIELKITLEYVEPTVTRTLQVLADIRLDRLHLTIQVAMGWTNSHLYMFEAGGATWGLPDPDFGSDDLPACVDRGKYVTWGEGWMHGNEETLIRSGLNYCDTTMTFIRYEVLRALARAVRRHGFSTKEIEAIFHDNAASLVAGFRRGVQAVVKS